MGPADEPLFVELRPSPGVAKTLEAMQDDLFSVLESAERAAAEIRREAEREAGGRVQRARVEADRLAAERVRTIGELTDDLAEQVRHVRLHSAGLMESLERQTRQVESAYAEMIESLAAISAKLAARAGEAPASSADAGVTEMTLAKRREVSLTFPRTPPISEAEKPR